MQVLLCKDSIWEDNTLQCVHKPMHHTHNKESLVLFLVLGSTCHVEHPRFEKDYEWEVGRDWKMHWITAGKMKSLSRTFNCSTLDSEQINKEPK